MATCIRKSRTAPITHIGKLKGRQALINLEKKLYAILPENFHFVEEQKGVVHAIDIRTGKPVPWEPLLDSDEVTELHALSGE